MVLSGENRNPGWARGGGYGGNGPGRQRASTPLAQWEGVGTSGQRPAEPGAGACARAVTIGQCRAEDPGPSDKDSVSGALHTSSRFLQAPVECYSLFSRAMPRIGVKVFKYNCAFCWHPKKC